MKDWLKFYFLSFFRNKYAKEADNRRALNLLLSAVLSIVLIFCGLLLGYTASFDAHYGGAAEFRQFVYSAFAEEGSRIPVKIKNGVFEADLPSGLDHIDSYVTGDYVYKDHKLIVDPRDVSMTFDDFSAYCVKNDGKNEKISYDEWRGLDKSERGNYSFGIDYSGVTLDTLVKLNDYEDWLDIVSRVPTDDEPNEHYDKTIAQAYATALEKLASGGIDERHYANVVYAQYVQTYYPDMSRIESFGAAPTIKTYYMRTVNNDKTRKYFILLEDMCAVSFVGANGVKLYFDGGYSDVDVEITSDMSRANAEKQVDKLIDGVFSGETSTNAAVYLMNVVMLFPWLLIAFIFCAFLIMLLCKLLKLDYRPKMGGACKIVGSFLFISGVVAFLLAIILSYVCVRAEAYMYTAIGFGAAVLARSIVFVIIEFIKTRRNGTNGDTDGGDQASADPDVFELADKPKTNNPYPNTETNNA